MRKDKDSVSTPAYILKYLNENYFKEEGEIFDPCPLIENWDPSKHIDGLKIKWGTNQQVFCNPPYSKACKFIEKAKNENEKFGTKIILLVKISSLCTHTFRRIHKHFKILFLDDRIQFDNYKRRAPFQSCFLLLGFPKTETFQVISMKPPPPLE